MDGPLRVERGLGSPLTSTSLITDSDSVGGRRGPLLPSSTVVETEVYRSLEVHDDRSPSLLDPEGPPVKKNEKLTFLRGHCSLYWYCAVEQRLARQAHNL